MTGGDSDPGKYWLELMVWKPNMLVERGGRGRAVEADDGAEKSAVEDVE